MTLLRPPSILSLMPAALRSLLGLTLGALLSVTCGPPGPPGGDCRFNPNCGGGLGGLCDVDSQCASGHCCDKPSCAHGMCTFECKNDAGCPATMRCDGGTCYFGCNGVADCAVGQECTKKGVCHWN